ncbi:hypothetical protein N9Y31_06505 [Alphaproteobacteria bacterium]|nr:hypothetical protein [Alphaproteobacteria bacterium]
MSEAQASMNGMIALWRALPNRPGLPDHGCDALLKLFYNTGAGKTGAGKIGAGKTGAGKTGAGKTGAGGAVR